ncbi:hypothetical protein C2S52_005399 [Perilla frutescens var. hirtella]|nr:hypothetical protein C2S52_005398 [Perilla frutescens var. hirtella]KAH6794922.1 hypothetical protein C2S52_005399 [Perilla frutescens var. hirtella]
MSFESMVKIITFLVIGGAILDETKAIVNIPPSKPDCYKKLDQFCIDEVRESICKGGQSFREILDFGCISELRNRITGRCLIDVLAQKAAESCNVDSTVAANLANQILDFFEGAS